MAESDRDRDRGLENWRPGTLSGPPGRAAGGEESCIDRHSTFSGKFHSSQNLRIEGQVDGELECDGTVTVAEKAILKATVKVQDMLVAGTAEGEITCRGLLRVAPTGRIKGSATAARLVVEEGAVFDGEMHMVDDNAGVTLFRRETGRAPAAAAPVPEEAEDTATSR